jgi:hypothetical protein
MAYRWLRRSPCIGQRGPSGLLDGEMELNAGSPGVSPARPKGPQSLGWRSRGYLPHFDGTSLVQLITFRLADALPARKLEQLEHHPRSLTDASRRRRLEAYLDAGHGWEMNVSLAWLKLPFATLTVKGTVSWHGS